MKAQHKVALFGNSMFMAGVEVSLIGKPGLCVARIDTGLPNATECLNALCPDVIVFDLAAPHLEPALSFLKEHPRLRLIGLDVTTNAVIELSGQRHTTLTANDLIRVIKKEEQ